MNNESAPGVPSADRVRAAAASWLLKRRDYDVWSEEDQRAFDVWLNESLAHRLAYLRLEAVWRDADRLKILRSPIEGSLLSSLRAISSRVASMAAVLAIGVGAWVGSSLYFSRPNEHTYATAIGQRKTVTLGDGSRIELNTGTTLRLSLGSAGRHVALLKGEAFFDITHDAKRPLVVDVGNYRVTDLGTQFAVRRGAKGLQVELVEGSVRFESSDGSKRLAVMKPGDVVMATADSLSLRKKPLGTIETALSWRRGVLVFHHTPLSEVVAEFNRYNTQKMTIVDAQIAGQTITATLPTNDVSAFTRIAKEFFGLHVTKHKDDILIAR